MNSSSLHRLKMALAAATVTVLSANVTSAATIGVNFADNEADEAMGAAESAGSPGFAQTNWNSLGRWGNATLLNDHTGTQTSVSIAWDAGNTWSTGVGLSTPDNKLMHGYLDSNGNANETNFTSIFSNGDNKPLLYFSGVTNWLASQGATSFNLVLYVDGDVTDGRIGEYWAQNVTGTDHENFTLGSDITPHIFNRDSSNFTGTYTQVDSAATSSESAGSGNYIVFTGLTADTFLVRTADLSRAPINGVQLIAVPEPSTVLLGGLGLLGLLRRRRA